MAVYGYIRHSLEKQELSAETQQFGIEQYCARLGLEPPSCYIDPAQYSKKILWDRPAGKELCRAVKRGDIVVVLRIDRLSRSMMGFGKILERWQNQGVIMHITDFAGGVFDPNNPMSRLMAHVLMSFADYQHEMIKQTTKEGLATTARQGRQTNIHAPYGFKFEGRFDRRQNKVYNAVVVNHEERTILAKMVELRAEGYSWVQIARYLNDDWKVTKRTGGKWGPEAVIRATRAYLKLMATEANAQSRNGGVPQPEGEDFDEVYEEEECLTKEPD